MAFVVPVLLMIAAAGPAADGKVEIARGEAVTLLLGPDGIVERHRQRTELSGQERESTRMVREADPAEAQGPNAMAVTDKDVPGPEAPVEEGLIRIRFAPYAQDESVLVIENGYGEALAYRAVIARGDHSERTDVCQILPHLRGLEHWPYPIDRIVLSDIRLEHIEPGTYPRCE